MTVIQEIAAERERQITVEGWTPDNDDAHDNGEMALAACCYAAPFQRREQVVPLVNAPPSAWPWKRRWWKPTTPRRDLIKAAALIVAEIERLDRKAAREART